MRHMMGLLLALIAVQSAADARELNRNELVTYARMIQDAGFDCQNASSGSFIGQNDRGVSFLVFCGNRTYTIVLPPGGKPIVFER